VIDYLQRFHAKKASDFMNENGLSRKMLPVIVFTVILTIASIFAGSLTGLLEHECKAESIAAATNIPYRLACEFTKPRFK